MGTLLGLNGSTVPKADLVTGIRAAGQAGFRLYEPRVPALTQCAEQGAVNQARELLGESNLSWLPLNALEDVFLLEPDALRERAEQIFALAAQFGVPSVIAVPGRRGERAVSPQEARNQLKGLISQAGGHGLVLLYELIGFEAHHFPTLEQALELAQAVGVKLVLDTFHLAVSRTPPEAVAALPSGAIGHVHLSDALTEGKTPEELTDDDRVLPGDGGLALAEFMAAVGRTGYGGPVSVEVFHPKYGERDPGEVASEALDRARQVLEAAGWPM